MYLHYRAGVAILRAAVADEEGSRRFAVKQLLCLNSTEISHKPAGFFQELCTPFLILFRLT